MTRACLSLLAGIYALQLNSFAVSSDYAGALLVALALLAVARRRWLLAAFTAGAALYYFAGAALIDSRITEEIAGDSIVVRVRVLDFAAQRNEAASFLATPLDDERLPRRIRLSWFRPPVEIHSGDRWQLEVRLRRPRGHRNPGGFDFEAWLFRERIAATGYVVDGPRNRLLRPGAMRLTERIRRAFIARVHASVADAEQASVIAAVGVGARHLISADQWERYAVTGSSHLMAISGLHVGLAAVSCYYVIFWIAGCLRVGGTHRNHHRIALALSLICAVGYAELSGLAVPARRASLMLLLAGACLLAKRRPGAVTILAATCIAIVVADPLTSMQPGFVLSFSAVAILMWLARRRKLNAVKLQVNLLFGLLPLTAWLFGRMSFAALPVNLVAIPLFALVTVPLTLAGLVLGGVLEPLGNALIGLAGQSVGLLERLLQWFAQHRWAAAHVPTLFPAAGLFLVSMAAWTLLPAGWPARSVAWLGLAAALICRPEAPAMGCARVTVLDVGQGLAVAIRGRAHTVLYDTGPAWRSGGNAAEAVILPFLREQRVGTLERLVVSHGDLDHAGGVAALTDEVHVARIFSGEALPGIRSTPCRAGQRWSYDGVEYRILHPRLGGDFGGNDGSCVLLVKTGPHSLLLSGDIERPAERALVAQQVIPQVTVVTVPHHGSRSSSTAPFIDALQARVAIVSAGFGNHWGFPKRDVVLRWHGAGAQLLETSRSGAIEFELCRASGLGSMREFRNANRRIWHE